MRGVPSIEKQYLAAENSISLSTATWRILLYALRGNLISIGILRTMRQPAVRVPNGESMAGLRVNCPIVMHINRLPFEEEITGSSAVRATVFLFEVAALNSNTTFTEAQVPAPPDRTKQQSQFQP
jgi:hypothetical protein